VHGTFNSAAANFTGTSNAVNANSTGTVNATNANLTGTVNATNADLTGTVNAASANSTGTSAAAALFYPWWPIPSNSASSDNSSSLEAYVDQGIVPLGIAELDCDAEFRAPITPESDVPGFLGLTSLSQKAAFLDTGGKRLILPGPGGIELKLSPGTLCIQLESSPSGHLLMPVSEFKHFNQSTPKRRVTFMTTESDSYIASADEPPWPPGLQDSQISTPRVPVSSEEVRNMTQALLTDARSSRSMSSAGNPHTN